MATTITAGNAVFLDTNILVYHTFSGSPLYIAANKRINEFQNSGIKLCISRQVLRESAAVLSRKDHAAGSLSRDQLINAIEGFNANCLVLEDNSSVTDHWLQLLSTHNISGRQVYDANIAATMLCYGVKSLLTNNVIDFKRFEPGIKVLSLET